MSLVLTTSVSGMTITVTVSGCDGATPQGTITGPLPPTGDSPLPGKPPIPKRPTPGQLDQSTSADASSPPGGAPPNQLTFTVSAPGRYRIDVTCGSESGSTFVDVP
jgi:hypothetical protein